MFDKTQEKNCPYCGNQDTIENFINWEKDGKKGLLGKTPEGFIMILCPNCEKHIKFDTLSGNFLRIDEKTKSGVIFNIVFIIIMVAIIYGVYKFFS